jgi:WD40-like Beta Propeller Repeat
MKSFTRRLIIAGTAVALSAGAVLGSVSIAGSAQYPGANGRIGYTWASANGYSIRMANPDGSGDVEIVSGGREATWSSGATKMAYIDSVMTSVMVADGDGANAIAAYTAASGYRVTSPSMSADGTRIAFTLQNSGYTTFDLYVVNADGTGLTNLTSGAYRYINANQISPDGTKVLFGGAFSSQPQSLHAATISTASVALVSSGKQYGAWMPDGSIFAVQNVAGASTAYRMNADGSGETVLFTGASIGLSSSVMWPMPSPDGTRLVFGVAGGGPGTATIWVSNIDGSGAGPIISNDGVHDPVYQNWTSGGVLPTTTTTTQAPTPVTPRITG